MNGNGIKRRYRYRYRSELYRVPVRYADCGSGPNPPKKEKTHKKNFKKFWTAGCFFWWTECFLKENNYWIVFNGVNCFKFGYQPLWSESESGKLIRIRNPAKLAQLESRPVWPGGGRRLRLPGLHPLRDPPAPPLASHRPQTVQEIQTCLLDKKAKFIS